MFRFLFTGIVCSVCFVAGAQGATWRQAYNNGTGNVFIYFAGANSCTRSEWYHFSSSPTAMGAYQHFRRFLRRHAPRAAHYVSCFGSRDMARATSSSLGNWSLKTYEGAIGNTHGIHRHIWLEDLASFVGQYGLRHSQKQTLKLHLFGHSYGGWLAMIVARALIRKGFHVEGLVTKDAISPKHCHPQTFLAAQCRSAANCRVTPATGCTQFPPDITAKKRQFLRNNVSYWLNFWQNEARYLKSEPQRKSPLREPTANIKIEFPNRQVGTLQGLLGDFQAHGEMNWHAQIVRELNQLNH